MMASTFWLFNAAGAIIAPLYQGPDADYNHIRA